MGSSLEVRVLWGSRWYEPLAGGKGVTARWVRRKPEAKLRPEEHEPHTRLGNPDEPAMHGDVRDHQGVVR
jgi:hypothetical protein